MTTKNDFDWLRWGFATAVAAVSMGITVVVWAYSTFPTKDIFEILIQRLDRIENKVDKILTIDH